MSLLSRGRGSSLSDRRRTTGDELTVDALRQVRSFLDSGLDERLGVVMAIQFATVVISGRATADPVSRPAGSTTVATFGVVVNDRKKAPSGDWIDDPMYIDVEAFGELATRVMDPPLPVPLRNLSRETFSSVTRSTRTVPTRSNPVRTFRKILSESYGRIPRAGLLFPYRAKTS